MIKMIDLNILNFHTVSDDILISQTPPPTPSEPIQRQQENIHCE